ncbi:unnamed protein product [Lactuca saligna]|uniref:BACK domain-containing protein n=1 Tax=Lactuca saligna TaxID=75948 RepID=A0AA36EBV2_LACSI|nr:unnamed protein product [Lactuca saligna]
MASLVLEDGSDDVMVVLTCIDRNEQDDFSHNQDEDAVMISTVDVYNWNFPSVLKHRTIKVKAQRNRLIEHSSYFHGLLGGNFGNPDLEILVQWNQPTFLSLLASLFGSPLDVTSESFLSLFEGALYFGMETIISKCMMWLTKAISVNGVPLLQLNDLLSIWEFGSELVNNYLPELCTTYLAKNFIWAMSCSSFVDVPYDLLLSSTKHPNLTVDSEMQLCDALLIWISANKEQYTEDCYINLLKQIRISLLPLWFASGKKTYESLSMCCNESYSGVITLLKQPFTPRMNALQDNELLNLRIRLTELTQRVDISCCTQMNPAILLLSVLPLSLNLEPQLRIKFEKSLINHESINAFPWTKWSNLTFEAVHEIDISNCPMLPLKVAIDIISYSFPSLRKLKAANHLSFKTLDVMQLVKKCPLLCDIDLTVDVSPVISTQVSILSSFLPTNTPGSFSIHWHSNHSNITKLILEGRNDVEGINLSCFSKLMSQAYMLKNLCLRDTEVVDDVLFNFLGSSLEVLDVSNTKVSSAVLAHVIGRNPGLKCLKTRGCNNLLHKETKSLFFEVCKLEEISVGSRRTEMASWNFSFTGVCGSLFSGDFR